MPVFNGGAGPDAYTGSEMADQINGNGGNDTLDGAGGNDAINGGPGDDLVVGGLGDDTLSGFAGADTVLGGDGADRMTCSTGATLDGGEGDDDFWLQSAPASLQGGGGTDTLRPVNASTLSRFGPENGFELYVSANRNIGGTAGNDRVDMSGMTSLDAFGFRFTAGDGNDRVTGVNDRGDFLNGGLGNDRLSGVGGDDTLGGADGDDTLSGGAGVDRLNGEGGRDQLVGGGGRDVLTGGVGGDVLTGGGGADQFRMVIPSESTVADPDTVTDFAAGADQLDLSTAYSGTFTLVTALTGAAGQLAVVYEADRRIVQGDVNGGGADFAVVLLGTGTLTEADFIL